MCLMIAGGPDSEGSAALHQDGAEGPHAHHQPLQAPARYRSGRGRVRAPADRGPPRHHRPEDPAVHRDAQQSAQLRQENQGQDR